MDVSLTLLCRGSVEGPAGSWPFLSRSWPGLSSVRWPWPANEGRACMQSVKKRRRSTLHVVASAALGPTWAGERSRDAHTQTRARGRTHTIGHHTRTHTQTQEGPLGLVSAGRPRACHGVGGLCASLSPAAATVAGRYLRRGGSVTDDAHTPRVFVGGGTVRSAARVPYRARPCGMANGSPGRFNIWRTTTTTATVQTHKTAQGTYTRE